MQVGGSYLATSAGQHHSLLLKSDRTAWSAGDNSHDQFGNGSYLLDPSAPTKVAVNIQAVSTGTNHTLMIANGDIRTTTTGPTIMSVTPATFVAGDQVTIPAPTSFRSSA